MKTILPQAKKMLRAFLLEEEGRITKRSAMELGVILTGASLAAILFSDTVQAAHTNSLSVSTGATSVTATHTHSTATGTATATGTGTGTGTGTYY